MPQAGGVNVKEEEKVRRIAFAKKLNFDEQKNKIMQSSIVVGTLSFD